MKVGLISDTHDRLPAITRLLEEFKVRGVEMVLHAGDYCAPFALRPFIDYAVPMVGIFGRTDGDREGLRAMAAQALACELFESPHSMQVGDHKILIVHDLADVHERSMLQHCLNPGKYLITYELTDLEGKLLLTGYVKNQSVVKIGLTRIDNGVYILTLHDSKKKQNFKIVKQ